MNCKKDDLAIITGAAAWTASNGVKIEIDLRGVVVRCAERCDLRAKPAWLFDESVPFAVRKDGLTYSGNIIGLADALLRPLRDDPGQDETLQWAPVPGLKVTP